MPEGAVGSRSAHSVALQTLTKYASEELCLSLSLRGAVRPPVLSDQVAWWKETAHRLLRVLELRLLALWTGAVLGVSSLVDPSWNRNAFLTQNGFCNSLFLKPVL